MPGLDEEWDPEFTEHSLRLGSLLEFVAASPVPADIDAVFQETIERFGPTHDWSPARTRQFERIMNVRAGLAAVQYHRSRMAGLEREVVERVRREWPNGWRGGTTASVPMPVVGHEYVAFLLAARRTLEYLARAVSSCFERDVYNIKKLGNALKDAKPHNLAAQVTHLCADVHDRFPYLLGDRAGRMSDRDRAAHYWPVEPASLLIVFFHDGRVGIELQDGGSGLLPNHGTLDPDRMTRDEPLLALALHAAGSALHTFAEGLLRVAVDAALWEPAPARE